MPIRPAILIPWCVVAALIAIGWVGWCEQPFCTTIFGVTRSAWESFLAQPAAFGAIVAMFALIASIHFQVKSLNATQRSNSAKMVLDAFARFDSTEMRERRRSFAGALTKDQSAVRLKDETPVLDSSRTSPTS